MRLDGDLSLLHLMNPGSLDFHHALGSKTAGDTFRHFLSLSHHSREIKSGIIWACLHQVLLDIKEFSASQMCIHDFFHD